MQDGDVPEAADMVMAMAVDSVMGCRRMFLADFPLPKVVGSHHHQLPMVAVFLLVEEFKEDINEALPSLPGTSPQGDSMVDLHKARHSTIPLPTLLDMHMFTNSRIQIW
jgi:hypothetical protein